MKHRSLYPLLTLLSIFLVILPGCQTIGPTGEIPEGKPATLSSAQGAEKKGEFLLAAREYERLSETKSPPEKQHYQLKAVEALIKAAQIHDARQKIRKINIRGLGTGLLARKRILQAYIAFFEGQHGQALELLRQARRIRNLNPTLVADIYWVRAQTLLALERPIQAVKNLIIRQRYVTDKVDISKNQAQLWKVLESQTRAKLKGSLRISKGKILKGWIKLAIIAIENAGNPRNLTRAIKGWRETHPRHPIEEQLLTSLSSSTPSLLGRIDRIALLLPLSSTYKSYGKAVHDGFMAMHRANRDPDKPRIKIYDVGDNPDQIDKYYDRAIDDGAKLIVGPLGRAFVTRLINSVEFTQPTILLSHSDEDISGSTPHIYQFGLQPEQEARQVAERAYLDGHRLAAVVYPDTEQGKRMMKAFNDHWQRLGGVILVAEEFDPRPEDGSRPNYTEAIKKLLNINQSEKRRRNLQIKIKERLVFFPRRRADIDFVFIAVNASAARQIKPLLNFYRASHIPVYATSRVFQGKANPRVDEDLNGIMFGDMPWILVGNGKIQGLRRNVQGSWKQAHTPWDRLYALGMDSYAIIPHLNRINTSAVVRFNGVTSGISLSQDGRFHRQLVWAIFRGGIPRIIDKFFNYTGQFELDDDRKSAKSSDPRP